MYELIQASDSSYYIQSPAKIRLVNLNEKEVCLIDSGNDKDAGRKIRQILDANGWKLTAIYNTHSNADHIGGNKYLQVAVYLDISLKRFETIFPTCGSSNSATELTIDELEKYSGFTAWIDVCKEWN